jgi:hypothetical protein
MSKNFFYLFVFFMSPLMYVFDGNIRIYLSLLIALIFLTKTPKLKIFISDKLALWTVIYCFLILVRNLVVRDESFTIAISNSLGIYFMFIPYQVLTKKMTFNAYDTRKSMIIFINLILIIFASSILSARFFNLGVVYNSSDLGGRYFGFMPDSASPILVFIIFYCVVNKHWVRFVCSLFLLTLIKAKAGYVLLFTCLITYLLVKYYKTNKIITVIISILFSTIIYYFNQNYNSIIETFNNFDYSYNNRLLMYSSAWDLFISNYVSGLNSFQIETSLDSLMYNKSIDNNYYTSKRIYNAILHSAVSLGILGLISFLMIYFSMIKKTLYNIKSKNLLSNNWFQRQSFVISLYLLNYLVFYQGVNWFYSGEIQYAFILVLFGFLYLLINKKCSI